MAASRFWEAMHADPQTIAIKFNPIMNDANRGAFRWALSGGGWVFMRQSAEDFVSPLIAATMSYDTAVKPGEQKAPTEETYDDVWERVMDEQSGTSEWG